MTTPKDMDFDLHLPRGTTSRFQAAVEAIPPGSVLVMDCRQDASVASAGSILITRMMVRGAAGVVSDGGLVCLLNH